MTYWLDWIWTVVALIGMVLSGYVWHDARRDATARQRSGQNGILGVVAAMAQREAYTICGAFLIMFTLGALVLASYRPPREPVANTVESAILIAMELGLLRATLLNLRDRHRITDTKE